MGLSNFHTHCLFCDGVGHPDEYVKKAISLGFKSLGFSSHAPVHFSNTWTMQPENVQKYCKEISILKEKYKEKINIYLGMEVDYFKEVSGPKSKKIRDLNLDYTLGSVHFIKNNETGEYLAVDGNEEEYLRILNEIFNGDIKEFVKEYYNLIRKMVIEHEPDIIGHIDLIKKNNKNNKYFSESENWYKKEIIKILDVIKQTKCIVELNTGGKARGYMDEFYPSEWIIKECRNRNIKIMINSDAHRIENLNAYFDDAEQMLKRNGIKEYTII